MTIHRAGPVYSLVQSNPAQRTPGPNTEAYSLLLLTNKTLSGGIVPYVRLYIAHV